MSVAADAIGKTMHEVLVGFTYKPGWTFVVEEPKHSIGGLWVLRIAWVCENSHNPGHLTSTVRVLSLPRDFGSGENIHEQLEGLLRRQLHECEKHEADGWMLFNGTRKFDPHA